MQQYSTSALFDYAVRAGYTFRIHHEPLPQGEPILLVTSQRLAILAPPPANCVELRRKMSAPPRHDGSTIMAGGGCDDRQYQLAA